MGYYIHGTRLNNKFLNEYHAIGQLISGKKSLTVLIYNNKQFDFFFFDGWGNKTILIASSKMSLSPT